MFHLLPVFAQTGSRLNFRMIYHRWVYILFLQKGEYN